MKAGFILSRPSRTPGSALPWWAAALLDWLRHNNCAGPGTRSQCMRRAIALADLLRYGIPNFKLEKHVIDRRIEQMRAEGVTFLTNAHVGVNVPVDALTGHYDAILLCGGAEQPRDLKIPGRELKGIHYAMEFLPQQNRRNEGDIVDPDAAISAQGKRVLIIGGGDTGADCLGTSHRQGA